MTAIRTFIILMFVATACAASPAKKYKVEPTNGTVSFTIMKWGVLKEEGTFREFGAQIDYDPANVAQSRVDFTVRVTSIDTKNDDRDSTLKGRDFFDAERYPLLTFRSTSVTPRGKGRADVTGDLTIKGVTKRVTVPVQLVAEGRRERVGDLAAFETTFTINRRDFGVTGGRWTAGTPGVLGEEVTVRIMAGGVSR